MFCSFRRERKSDTYNQPNCLILQIVPNNGLLNVCEKYFSRFIIFRQCKKVCLVVLHAQISPQIVSYYHRNTPPTHELPSTAQFSSLVNRATTAPIDQPPHRNRMPMLQHDWLRHHPISPWHAKHHALLTASYPRERRDEIKWFVLTADTPINHWEGTPKSA